MPKLRPEERPCEKCGDPVGFDPQFYDGCCFCSPGCLVDYQNGWDTSDYGDEEDWVVD